MIKCFHSFQGYEPMVLSLQCKWICFFSLVFPPPSTGMGAVITLKRVPIQFLMVNEPAGKYILEWKSICQTQLISFFFLFFFPIDLCTCLHYCPRHTACDDLFMESSPWWIILGLYLILPCLLRTWAPVLGALQGLDGSGVLSNDQWLTLYLCHILVGAQFSGILSLLWILWYTKYTSPSFVNSLVRLPEQ